MDPDGSELMMAIHDGDITRVAAALAGRAHEQVPLDQIMDTARVSAVCWAASRGHAEILSLLIAAGFDINRPTGDGETPLMIACENGHVEAVTILLAAGAYLESPGGSASAPLCRASWSGVAELTRLLLAAGAEIEAAGENGPTALWMASVRGHEEIVATLIAAGANVNWVATEDDMSVVAVASQAGHSAIVRLLVDAGADLNWSSDDGLTALDLASRENQIATVKLLWECRLRAWQRASAADFAPATSCPLRP
jgi:ankyrin repeat protein